MTKAKQKPAPVPEFFSIKAGIEDGLALDGSPEQYDVEKCAATRREVCDALAWVARNRPELRDTMRVAIAMLVCLDTIRDEAWFSATFAQRRTESGDVTAALESVGNVLTTLGHRGELHSLYLQ